jgi:hypothetical protein
MIAAKPLINSCPRDFLDCKKELFLEIELVTNGELNQVATLFFVCANVVLVRFRNSHIVTEISKICLGRGRESTGEICER